MIAVGKRVNDLQGYGLCKAVCTPAVYIPSGSTPIHMNAVVSELSWFTKM